ncbi:MAG: arginyltransferase [Deferrisomatales bacterium]
MPPQTMSHFPALPVPLGVDAVTTGARECPYLPGRKEVSRAFRCDHVPGWAYQALMDAGFRRCGDVFYQMCCPGCRACVPLRVPVAAFRPSKSQRRTLRRNTDLSLSFGRPRLTEEKHRLYARYLEMRHDGKMSGSWQELEGFLYRSPTDTVEMTYRDPAGALLGVGICDLTPVAVSTVYFYFDPDQARRGLGTFSSLTEIAVARSLGLSYYYLGFWVKGCARMEYKSRLRPSEALCTDGRWRPFGEGRG